MSSRAARVLVFGAGIVAGAGLPALASAAPEDSPSTPPESSAAADHSDQHATTTTAGSSGSTTTTASTSTSSTSTTSTTDGGRGGAGGQLSDEGTRPPGNNGTVKVDGIPFDDHPNNEPHVGCTFQIDFYNYDEGDLQAIVEFALHDPTDEGTMSVSGDPLTLDIGEDPNGGGTDLDASGTYTLAFTGAAHPQQGHHVRLTIHAEGSQGADVKHKVFWVEGCGAVGSTTTTTQATTTTTTGATTSTTTGGTTSTTTGGTTSTTIGGTTSTTAGVGGTTATTVGPTTQSTVGATVTSESVLGVTLVQSPPAAQPVTEVQGVTVQRGPAALARTGAGLAGLAALGAGLVIAGQATRRRATR